MDFFKVNSLANNYLLRFGNRDYGDTMGVHFVHAFQNDLEKAGFEYDMNEAYSKVYPSEWPVNHPEHIEAIKDIQTVGNTIYTVFHKVQKDGPFYDVPETRQWLICALKHLADLADDELRK